MFNRKTPASNKASIQPKVLLQKKGAEREYKRDQYSQADRIRLSVEVKETGLIEMLLLRIQVSVITTTNHIKRVLGCHGLHSCCLGGMSKDLYE